MSGILLLIAVAVVSAAGTWTARAYALQRRLVDQPGERRSHSTATPRGGGAGPVAGMLLALCWPPALDLDGRAAWSAGLALAAVALVGGWDDHRSLPASGRLAVHVVAAVLVGSAFFDPRTAPVAFALACAAVVVLINVWNFMDGIDGIAATQAALVAATAALVAPATGWIGAVVAAASLAFLPFNFPRAKVFLGDVGSGPIGLAVALAWIAAARSGLSAVVAVALPASAFLVDAGLTLLRRIVRRERWWEPHTQHAYQGLARRHGHAPVALAYAAWTFLGCGAAYVLSRDPDGPTLAYVAVWYMAAGIIWFVLQHLIRRSSNAR